MIYFISTTVFAGVILLLVAMLLLVEARVVKKGDGDGYAAVMFKGRIKGYGATEGEAFENAAAQALGFKTPTDLRAHNAGVRQHRRAAKARAEKAKSDQK